MHNPTHNPDLLLALQSGLPLDVRPFARIGAKLGLTEDDVLVQVRELFDSGVARRFGAVFDSSSLGYSSTLCAVDVPEAELDAVASRMTPHPGITHCYLRDGHPNLWFTLTAPADGLEQELARLGQAIGPWKILNLPALQKFKIEAVFGRPAQGESQRAPGPAPLPSDRAHPGGRRTAAAAAAPFAESDKAVVRVLQASIPVSADPFGDVARQLGRDPVELLDLLRRWKESGVIRRIGLIVRHHKLGFSANSMCVWPVGPERIEAAGRSAGNNPHVTHCYERPFTPAFPYNLYAMIHAKSREEAEQIFAQIAQDAALTGGRMFWSVREFKKSSPVFFQENAG